MTRSSWRLEETKLTAADYTRMLGLEHGVSVAEVLAALEPGEDDEVATVLEAILAACKGGK